MSEFLEGSVGILMLDTRFPRIIGDPGNKATWPFDVHYHIVQGATASDIVCPNDIQNLQPFIEGARALESRGVAGITTSCGFLSLVQEKIAAQIDIPFAASSLMQIPLLESMLGPGKRVGVLTIDSQALTAAHLQAAGAAIDTPVGGTQMGKEFTRAILSDALTMDFNQCRIDNESAALALMEQHPEVSAIVLECTNMVPYAKNIQAVTGLPVYSIYSFVRWFQSGLKPASFQNKQHG